jgi:hypothetical protein
MAVTPLNVVPAAADERRLRAETRRVDAADVFAEYVGRF